MGIIVMTQFLSEHMTISYLPWYHCHKNYGHTIYSQTFLSGQDFHLFFNPPALIGKILFHNFFPALIT